MDWKLDDGRPIWPQLSQQLARRIIAGVYPPGSRLPSVRELAAEAGVNPNTMQRALTELERDGLVYSQRTAGRFVTEDKAMIETAKRALAERHITAFLDAMTRLGYQREEVINMLRQEITGGGNGDVSLAV